MAKAIVEKTVQEEQREKLLDTLADLGGQTVSTDTLKFQGKEMILPETMVVGEAIEYLQNWSESQDEETIFSKRFQYRPWDGAYAVQEAMKRVFGSSGIQQAEWFFWSKRPPQRREIQIGFGQTAHIPWGNITIPLFKGMMTLDSWNSPTFGELFQLHIRAAKKYEPHAQAVFQLVQKELQERSIYRGKAIDGAAEPNFIDLNMVDPTRVIYSEDALQQLQANIWSLMERTDTMRLLKMPLKRAVLLHGPYGTGKTLAAFRTAQIATANDWTFIYCRPGQDVLTTVLQTARLYTPAIVFVEDLDAVEKKNEGDADVVSILLDAFDGITTKGAEVMMVLTTNHPERINKAMLRPGRLDAVVEIGALDQMGVTRMIEAIVPERNREADLDYMSIYEAMEGFLPAFVKEAIDRAIRYAIARDEPSMVLTTTDFVFAADGLKPQLKMMAEAGEPKLDSKLESVLADVVRDAVHGVGVDQDGDRVFVLNGSDDDLS